MLLKSNTEGTSDTLLQPAPQSADKTKFTFKDKHPLFYIGAATQITLCTILLIFFALRLTSQPGYISNHPDYWWLTLVTCVSLILSIVCTALLPLNKKIVFYGICCLDIIEAILISSICSAIGRVNYAWQTAPYQLLNTVGDIINYHTLITAVSIVAVIALHCYAMFRILNLKYNGTSRIKNS